MSLPQSQIDLQRRQQAEAYAEQQRRRLPSLFANLKIPGAAEADEAMRRNPELRDIAIGEDYGKSRPGLYRIRPQDSGVSIESLGGPSRSSFMPGESAGMPDSFWERQFPFLRATRDLRRQQPGYAEIGGNPTDREAPLPSIRPVTTPDSILQRPTPQQPSPRIAIGSQPATGITGTLNLPQPNEVHDPNVGMSEMRFPAPDVTSPAVGGSIRGSKLDRDIMLREAMASADPESRVRVSGDQIDVSPPPMKGVLPHRSRWSTAGEAALNALGSADPDRPLYSLGQGLGATLTGMVSPRAGAKLNRRFDLQRLDSDIARGLKLESAQSDLASAEALRRLERQKVAGQIDQRTYEQERDRLNRESRERIAAEGRASQEKIAGMRPTGAESRQAKAQAAQEELDQLIHDEAVAGANKNRAYKYLEDLKRYKGPNGELATKEDVDQATRAAEEANKVYNSFGEKKRDAQRRIRENQVSTAPATSTPPPPPPGVTEASVRAEARRRGQDENAAVQRARDFKWIP